MRRKRFPSLNRRVVAIVAIPFVLFAIGTAGYALIEGWSLLDALYMTAITLTTVGFGEVRPLTTAGRLFTILLLVLGVAFIAYGLEYLLTANLGGQYRRRRIMRTIDNMRDHVIVCGYGRVGRSATAALVHGERDILIIEKEPDRVAQLEEEGLMTLVGDATNDETLLAAGIERAWGLIICTGEDSQNLFIVLSARALNARLYIVTRSIEAANESKMRRAGADRVVSPYQIGGQHMANIVIRPQVTDFFDVVTLDGGIELWVDEVRIHDDSPLVGKSVSEANVRRETGVTMIAHLPYEGGTAMALDTNTLFSAGDQFIVLGTREQLAAFEALAARPPT